MTLFLLLITNLKMSDQPDIMSAIRQIAAERKIDFEEILDAIKQAIKAGFKWEYDPEDLDLIHVDINPEIGQITVFVVKTVVAKVTNQHLEISIADAKKLEKDSKVGDKISVDITPEGNFGRIAAQTARQIIVQELRESEKRTAIAEVAEKIGTIENVIVQRFTRESEAICEINKARAVMPKNEQIPTEFYKLGTRIKVLLKSIEEDARGKYVLISRSDPKFLAELFRLEVPEIDSGTVEIVSIAREEGSRSKIAVRSNADGVDPIGSCVGQKGVRINTISNELKLGNFEEKLDIILWDDDQKTFLKNAIRPAEAVDVIITDEKSKEAIIVVPDDQQSLAIGKDGQNVRLSAKLTGWKLDIQSVTERETGKSSKDDSKTKKSKAEKEPVKAEKKTKVEKKTKKVTEKVKTEKKVKVEKKVKTVKKEKVVAKKVAKKATKAKTKKVSK